MFHLVSAYLLEEVNNTIRNVLYSLNN